MIYQKRLSSPLLDRIDIRIEVLRLDYEKLSSDRMGEPSSVIRKRVQAARDIQPPALSSTSHIACNADMRIAGICKFCALDEASSSLMKSAMTQMNRPTPAYYRLLKLARTIADLAGSEMIQCFDRLNNRCRTWLMAARFAAVQSC